MGKVIHHRVRQLYCKVKQVLLQKRGASSYYKEARIRKWRNLYYKVRSIYCKVLGKLLQNRAVHLRDTRKELTHDYR